MHADAAGVLPRPDSVLQAELAAGIACVRRCGVMGVDGLRQRSKKNFRKCSEVYKQNMYTTVVVVVNGGPSLWTKRLTLDKSSA